MNFDKLIVDYYAMRQAGDKAGANSMLKAEGYTAEEIRPALDYYARTGKAIDYGTMDAVVQGMSFGLSDEISAAAQSLFADGSFMDAYDQKVNEIRERQDIFAQVNPGTALAAEMAGSIVTGFALPMGLIATSGRIASAAARGNRLAKGLNPVSKYMSTAAKDSPIKAAAALGATEGALAGFGSGRGGVDSSLGALGGGILGGATGAAGSAVVGAASRAFRNADKRAMGEVADALATDGVDVGKVRGDILRNTQADEAIGLSGTQEMLVDYAPLGGRSASLLRGARATVGGAGLDDALRARSAGDTAYSQTNLGRSSQADRVQAQVSNVNLRKQTIDEMLDEIDDAVNTDLSYQAAFANNTGIMDARLFNTLKRVPRLRKAFKKAAEHYNGKYRNDPRPDVPTNVDSLFDPKTGGIVEALPLEFLDAVKREAQDGLYLDVFKKGKLTKKGAGAERKLIGEYTAELKDAVNGPEYKEILKRAADKFALGDAAEIGEKLMKMSPREVKLRLKKLSKTELEAVRIGMLENIRETLNATPDATDVLKQLVGSPAARQKIDILFGDDIKGKTAFVDRIKREVVYQVNKNFLSGGSQTADKMRDAAMLDLSRDLAIGIADPVTTAGVAGFRRGAEMRNEATANAVKGLLTDQNPASQMNTLNRLEQAQRANQALATGRLGAGLGLNAGLLYGLNGYSDRNRQR